VAVATNSQNKTGFVKKFLQNNPQANTNAVNQAWTAAGMKGTISHPIVSEQRKLLGLTSNRSKETKPAAKAKPGAKKSKPALNPGKSMFVKEFLNDHPRGNLKAVNEAWRAAGFDGTVSKTVLFKVKSSLGLTGTVGANAKKTKATALGDKRLTPRKETTASVNLQTRVNRSTVLDELEADIDRLIFKAMAIGDLTEFEDLLRQARRALYGALTRG
jgi:hypothetical protein